MEIYVNLENTVNLVKYVVSENYVNMEIDINKKIPKLEIVQDLI